LKAAPISPSLAKKNSDDGRTAQNGGNLDWVVRGQTPPNSRRLRSAQAERAERVVTTQIVINIIQVLEKQPHM